MHVPQSECGSLRGVAAFALVALAALPPCGCGSRAPGGAAAGASKIVTRRLDPEVISACDGFRLLKGRNRVREGRVVFDRALPQYVWIQTPSGLELQPGSGPEMTSEEVESLLGPPDKADSERMIYYLGSDKGEDHSIEILLKNGKVVLALTSLDAGKGGKGPDSGKNR